jgi:Flp pilus assembly protein TadD
MATCPDARLRDPPRALEFAKKRHQLAAPDAISLRTLGVACYRAGDSKAAVAALTQSTNMREGGDGFGWFFLAMAYWQLGDRGEARQWYDKAVA